MQWPWQRKSNPTLDRFNKDLDGLVGLFLLDCAHKTADTINPLMVALHDACVRARLPDRDINDFQIQKVQKFKYLHLANVISVNIHPVQNLFPAAEALGIKTQILRHLYQNPLPDCPWIAAKVQANVTLGDEQTNRSTGNVDSVLMAQFVRDVFAETPLAATKILQHAFGLMLLTPHLLATCGWWAQLARDMGRR